jgi:hypothetical protein
VAQRRPLVIIGGQVQELPTGDSLVGAESGGVQLQPVANERVLEWSSSTPNRFQRMMQAGVVDYVIPAVPNGAVEVQVNGVGVNYTLDGVNLHITEYTPGTIDDSDELTVYYAGSAVGGSTVIHELVVTEDGDVVMMEVLDAA